MPYALALGLTLLVEVPLYTMVLTRLGRVGRRSAVGASILVNLVTHPLLWWFLNSRATSAAEGGLTAGGLLSYPLVFMLSELVVCLVEALLLRLFLRLRGPLPYAAALTANAASVLAGLAVTV